MVNPIKKPLILFLVFNFLVTNIGIQPLFAGSVDVNVSGQDGEDGRNGGSYGSSAGPGQHGGDGGDATEPTRGTSAGEIDVSLTSQASTGAITFEGTYVESTGTDGKVKKSISITQDSVVLSARGGDGGNGANGGRGQNGGDGRDGADATRYSPGENGQNGGNGGDGGRGTSGESAGAGGKVSVNISEEDMDLLMLVSYDVDGGSGGSAGRNGAGGDGGSGGSGGRSYTWYEDVPDGEDSNGKPKYKRISHTMPGGAGGAGGSGGGSPNVRLEDGANGRAGKYVINVRQKDGTTKSYSDRYALDLESYEFQTDDNDGIIEPGEKVYLRNIRIRNNGKMPTPTQTKITVFLTNTKYGIAEPLELIIDKSLQPNEMIEFKGQRQLAFVVKDPLIDKIGEETLEWTDTAVPVARMARVERDFAGFNSARSFQISFPVKIEPIVYFKSLAIGERYRLTLKVTNVSDRDFGSASEIQRGIQLFVQQTQGTQGAIAILGDDGKPWDLNSGTLQAIAKLKKGESVLIETVVTTGDKAESNLDTDISVQLGIDKFGKKGKIENIQQRMLNLHIAETYKKSKDSQVLIIADSASQKDQLAQVRGQLQKLGLKADVWDVGYYGTMALLKSLPTQSTLAQDFKDKRVIYLTDGFTTPVGEISTIQLKRRQDLVQMLTVYGASVTAIGPNSNQFLDGVTIPTGAETKGTYKNIDQVLRAIRFGDKERLMESRARDITAYYREFVFKPFLFFGEPSEDALRARADRLAHILTARYPDRNYVVTYEFSPEVIKSGGFLGLGKRWRSGVIQVRRTLDLTQAPLVTVDPRSVGSGPEEQAGLLAKALSMGSTFQQKLETLKFALKRGNSDSLDYVIESLVTDLVIEQIKLRRTKTAIRVYKDETTRAMPLFEQLLKSGIQLDNSATDTQLRVLLALLTTVDQISQGLVPWWERYFIPFQTNKYAASATRFMVKRAISEMFVMNSLLSRRDNAISSERWAKIRSQAQNESKRLGSEKVHNIDDAYAFLDKLTEKVNTTADLITTDSKTYDSVQSERLRADDENKQTLELETQLKAARDELKSKSKVEGVVAGEVSQAKLTCAEAFGTK